MKINYIAEYSSVSHGRIQNDEDRQLHILLQDIKRKSNIGFYGWIITPDTITIYLDNGGSDFNRLATIYFKKGKLEYFTATNYLDNQDVEMFEDILGIAQGL